MDTSRFELSRRTALGLAGAAAVTLSSMTEAFAEPSTADDMKRPQRQDVSCLINGEPAQVGSYAFPSEIDTLVLDNGLIRFTFGRDDPAGGVVTGWPNVSVSVTSVIVDGIELAHNLNGVDPRDPDRQHSFYIDAGGGATRLVCTQVRVLRSTRELVEVVFIDDTSTPLQHAHHLIMRMGKRGLYGYDILTAAVANSINEVRMNARWDRSIFDHAYNWERGKGQQPTYAYLATQDKIGDETWVVDGVNNPNLPSPESNSANLPPGSVYTKYNWSLYHHENPMFGHYGNGFGAWLTPLGGVTEDTLCAFYGVGPQHQDLAIHQDALILNYFGANHYGLPSYPLNAGYRRLYGPWFVFITTGSPADADAMIAAAAATAQSEIEENRSGASWISDPLYPAPGSRTTVTGRLYLTDGRPAEDFWVLLSTQDSTDVYPIHEPTYFVKTDADGHFELPAVPPAWQPGTTTPATYTLYAFASKGSVTDQYEQTGIKVSGPHQDLGTIVWTPTSRTTFLWQIGRADRTAGEFALASLSPVKAEPRAYEKPAQIPGDLTFTIGESWEPADWYYAQTNPGVWTVSFTLDRSYSGTAYLMVSTAMQQGGLPTVAINGSTTAITGSLPPNNDSTIARQADRSGYPRLAVLTFPAAALTVGTNTLTFTHGQASAAGAGPGWDTLLLEVDEVTAPQAAELVGRAVQTSHTDNVATWRVTIANTGAGEANDVHLDGVTWLQRGNRSLERPPVVMGRDPNKFPVPVVGRIPAGGSSTVEVTVDASSVPGGFGSGVVIEFTANGGRARGTASAKKVSHGR